MFSSALAIVVVLIWLYLTFAHGHYWQIRPNLSTSESIALHKAIVAIVPARNEADVIARTVTGLLNQQLIPPVQIVLVDDNSSDQTAQHAREAAAAIDASDRLHAVSGEALPAGWTGKMWAVYQGAQQATSMNPDYFLLTDADVYHEPGSLASLLRAAENGNYDLASYMVKLATATRAERLLIPAFVYFFFQLYPPSLIANKQSRVAGAAGGCILIRPQALIAAGGIEAIKDEMIDDCALARIVKRSGGRVFLSLTDESHSIRSYGSFAGVGRMIARSAFTQLRHSYLLLALTVIGLPLTYVAPPLLLFSGTILPSALGFIAWMLMSFTFWPTVRFYRQPVIFSMLLPLIALFYAGATVYSAWQYAIGSGGQWKGRIQNPSRR